MAEALYWVFVYAVAIFIWLVFAAGLLLLFAWLLDPIGPDVEEDE